MTFAFILDVGVAFLGGILAYLWGPFDALLLSLVVMVVLDYLSGVIKAIVNKQLSSEVGWKGLLKKLMLFLLIGLGCVIDRLLDCNGAIRAALCFFYIANEALSVLENFGAMGLPLPDFLKKILVKLRETAIGAQVMEKADGTDETHVE